MAFEIFRTSAPVQTVHAPLVPTGVSEPADPARTTVTPAPTIDRITHADAANHGRLDGADAFVAGFADGVRTGVSGALADVDAIARHGYDLATSAAARQNTYGVIVNDTRDTQRATATALKHPADAIAHVGGAATEQWRRVSAAYRRAAADGNASEFIGGVLGQGAVALATAVPSGGVGVVADALRAMSVAGDLGRAAELARSTAEAVGSTTKLSSDAAAVRPGFQPAAARSTAASQPTVTTYRVEGAANRRLLIGDHGTVTIPNVVTRSGAERNLYLNFGDEMRAKQFLTQRLRSFPDSVIKQFEVPKSFVDQLRAAAVPESERSLHPRSPVIADPTKAVDQFGLSGPQIETLRNVLIPGSGKLGGG